MNEDELDPDPFVQFGRWRDAAIAAQIPEPDAMVLATATRDGQPSARFVMLRGIDERGFVFFTNHGSRKAAELADNPRAALIVYWEPLHRQVRIEGSVARVTTEESEQYFASRPRPSRLSAWASPQGEVIEDRTSLDALWAAADRRFAEEDVPLPPFWGGYRVEPSELEFWAGHRDRLHDRLRYRRAPSGAWTIARLAP